MSKRECDIIKDLLPSYVDEICSEASKEWVEEHLAGCEECRATAEVMKHTEISSERLEQEQLDAAKKIVMQNLRRSVFALGFCFLLLIAMVYTLGYDRFYGQIPLAVIYLALPVCMAMSWLVGRNQTKQRKYDKWDTASLVAAVVAMGYGVGLVFLGLSYLMKNGEFLGMQADRVGPFVGSWLLIVLGVCLLLYLVQIGRIIKQGRAGSVVMNLCLTGVFLMLGYRLHLGEITSFEAAMKALFLFTMVLLAIGALGILLFVYLDKRAKK